MIGYVSVFIVIVALAVYLLPSELEPTVWLNPPPLVDLPITNTVLNHTIKLHEYEILAPESIAFDIVTGYGYASLGDGRVVELNSKGDLIGEVLFIGGFINKLSLKSDEIANLKAYCTSEYLAGKLPWNISDERRCGRPLGLRVATIKSLTYLYIADAYHGIFTICLTPTAPTYKQPNHILDSSHAIQVPSGANPVSTLPIKFYNDLEVLSDGKVLFTDSSYKYTRSQNRQELSDGAPRGRLFEYDPHTKALRGLICGLHFPNGVQLIPGKNNKHQDLLLVELTRLRILRVNLSVLGTTPLLESCGEYGDLYHLLNHTTLSPPSTSSEVSASPVSLFVTSLPGIPDNIRLNQYKPIDPADDEITDYLTVGAFSKSSKPFSFIVFLLKSTLARQLISKLVSPQRLASLVPKCGLVFLLDLNGRLIDTWHDPKGQQVTAVSEAQRHPITGDLWIGSHSNKFLGVVPASEIPPVKYSE